MQIHTFIDTANKTEPGQRVDSPFEYYKMYFILDSLYIFEDCMHSLLSC